MHYTLSWKNPNDHLFDVTLRFVAPENDPLLWLPAWRPGRYLIQNYAANVREWSANLRKVGKSEWRAAARAGEEVVVSYRYYAGTLDAGSSFLDDEEAYFNGSNLFMCVDALRGEPVQLSVDTRMPVEMQLPRGDDGVFRARDYDHLIDLPAIASAALTRHSFDESGARFHLVVRGGGDFEPFVEPLQRIVRAQAALFGGLPVDEYKFLIHVGDRWHGVEHEASSSLIVKRAALPSDEGHDHFLGLCAHELFHVWNVKRIVPAAFAPYDYLRETPTRLLWAMEGITSYYGELSLVRAGVWDETRWLEHLREEIETLENAPARHYLSLAQASFDGWLAPWMPEKLSFYNKGEVVAALLDLTIRSNTEHSLDDVMRVLWRERILSEDAVERAVAEVAGAELARDFFARYVDGVEPLPYEELLGRAAVAFDSASGERLALGAKLTTTMTIESVTPEGSAMEAGLLPGDELLAIAGERVTSEDDVERIFESLSEGDAVPVVIARGGLVSMRPLVPRRDPHVRIALRVTGESALRDAWLRSEEQ